jgi:hypothetical protein
MNLTLLCFNISLLVYVYQSITGNEKMVQQSFQGLVILGLITLLNQNKFIK